MKTLKQHIKDTELDDFEEDLMAEKAPNTADAMKRYKAGKAGFTDKAHLKAKGLIARSVMAKSENQTSISRRRNENF